MRIVVDPKELNRFAAFVVEAADDHVARANRLRALESPSMPGDIAATVADGIGRVASDLENLSSGLYAQAFALRARAAVLDPLLRRYLMPRLVSPPE